tara:strand:- start:1087 stop:1413 length:327 start_codon:yes stop_codon:yes gene_type:complete
MEGTHRVEGVRIPKTCFAKIKLLGGIMKFHKFTIKKPIWHGGDKQRSVGIAEYRLPCLLKIDYKYPDGTLMYPNRYKVTKGQAMKYPVKVVGNNIKLRIIPINELKEG